MLRYVGSVFIHSFHLCQLKIRNIEDQDQPHLKTEKSTRCYVSSWSQRRCAGGALQQGDTVTTIVGIISLLLCSSLRGPYFSTIKTAAIV